MPADDEQELFNIEALADWAAAKSRQSDKPKHQRMIYLAISKSLNQAADWLRLTDDMTE